MDTPTPHEERVHTALEAIARGEPASWEGTFKHPRYGDLTCRVPELPKNKDWLRHATLQDELIIELGAKTVVGEDGERRTVLGNPNNVGSGTAQLASAIAALKTIIQVPVIEERRIEDPENAAHERIEKVYYDPLEDDDMSFALQVWTEFWVFRLALLNKVGDLGKSSGETPGSASDASSPAATVSPSTTADSPSGQIATTSASSPS